MNGWIETKVQEIKFLWYWVLCRLTIHERAAVELPLLVTFLRWLLLLVLAESPYIRSFFNLSTTISSDSTMAMATKTHPNCQDNLLTVAS